MYPIKPGFVAPQSAEDFARNMHQSTIKHFIGPFSCPARAKYLLVDGYRNPPAASTSFGTAWDRLQTAIPGTIVAHRDKIETLTGYYQAKLESGEAWDKKQVEEVFEVAWEEEAQSVEIWGDESKGSLLDIGVKAIPAWLAVAKNIQPIALHQDLAVEVDTGESGRFFLRGSLDMTARKGVRGIAHARDAKTAGRRWTKGQELTQIQAPHYSILVANDPASKAAGVDPNRFTFEVMVKNKLDPICEERVVEIDDKAREGHLRLVATVRDWMMRCFTTGDFPANRECMTCSRDRCGFWELCEKEHGGTVRSKEV